MSSSSELPVGRIAGVFGVTGELKCDPSSAGRSLFAAGETLSLRLADGTAAEMRLDSVREHKGRLLIRFPGVNSANDAQRYVGGTFHASRDRIQLGPGEYLDVDLCGCELFDPNGKLLGRVSRVEHYPSSDMLVVGGSLVPLIGEFIKSVDVGAKRIVADLPIGLLDESQAERA